MTDIRELLELAARAMGGSLEVFSDGSFTLDIPRTTRKELGSRVFMRPDKSSGDCADMCAAMRIGTDWAELRVICAHRGIYGHEQFADHNNDRSAAWRLAALRVAAEIGSGMP